MSNVVAAPDAPLPPPTLANASVDAFLGGRLEAVQPGSGHHRAGMEAILLAAAIEPSFAGVLVDLGAGVGVAGLAVAARCPAAQVVLVERDPTALACARATLALPVNSPFAGRVSVLSADIAAREGQRVAAGLKRSFADAVIVNPPFHSAEQGTASPNEARAAAHVLAPGGLDPWIRTATSILKPDGRLIIIFRADGLDAVTVALGRRYGNTAILPIHPRAGIPAVRVLIRTFKGRRANTRILPGLILHGDEGGAYMPSVEAMLRGGGSLVEAHPPWAI